MTTHFMFEKEKKKKNLTQIKTWRRAEFKLLLLLLLLVSMSTLYDMAYFHHFLRCMKHTHGSRPPPPSSSPGIFAWSAVRTTNEMNAIIHYMPHNVVIIVSVVVSFIIFLHLHAFYFGSMIITTLYSFTHNFIVNEMLLADAVLQCV